MQVSDIPIEKITAPDWNANEMDQVTRERLQRSIKRYGLVVPLVVRPLQRGTYETIGGAQRLAVMRELGFSRVPCVLVEVDDAEAMLLAQALNRIAGVDNPGLRARALRRVMASVSVEEILSLLPETAQSLNALASLGQQDMATYLQNWEQAQSARLKHLAFQFIPSQVEIIEEALARVLPEAKDSVGENPNLRGTALYLICQRYLHNEEA